MSRTSGWAMTNSHRTYLTQNISLRNRRLDATHEVYQVMTPRPVVTMKPPTQPNTLHDHASASCNSFNNSSTPPAQQNSRWPGRRTRRRAEAPSAAKTACDIESDDRLRPRPAPRRPRASATMAQSRSQFQAGQRTAVTLPCLSRLAFSRSLLKCFSSG
jgi:hypothetical protein